MIAIPTAYRGIQFRSRLEAKWASFFDILGWNWEYEPFDCKGWIPDFMIKGAQNVLVEVKPITELSADLVDELERAVQCECEFPGGTDLLILGCSPLDQCDEIQLPGCRLGWIGQACEFNHGAWDYGWSEARAKQWIDGKIGFCSDEQGYVDRISGEYDGTCMDIYHTGTESIIRKAWSAACNSAQWKSPRRRT